MRYEERHLLADRRMLEIGLDGPAQYRLRYGWPGDWLISYVNGRRCVGARHKPYSFSSVEQLRYDFERDVEDARRQG